MPQHKPLVVVTRRLPDTIETRMRELFKAALNINDQAMSGMNSSKRSKQRMFWFQQ